MSGELVTQRELAQILFVEAKRRRLSLGLIFAVVALAALAVGIFWPKKYTSSTTILVQESSIIKPLMEGRAVPTGVADRASINRAFDLIQEKLGVVDVAINNAGLSAPAPFPEMSDAQWTSVLEVNLSGPYHVSQEMARRLIARKLPGAIVNVASILGKQAKENFINYGVTKGALINLTEYMALDLMQHGIRVNAIAPGYFPSEMTNPFFESEAGKREIANLPPKRLGRLEELDGALLLLASEASSYISGSTLTVDCAHSVRLS
jgi:NAD(P)-dependent dehydrogenase (short-subunit alcohol dehydrogenase family)